MFTLKEILFFQVESKFEVVKEAQYTQMVSVCADGRTVTGTTSGGQALLISINGAQFSTPAVLSGSAILFQAKSDPKLLASVAGMSRVWTACTSVMYTNCLSFDPEREVKSKLYCENLTLLQSLLV